MTFLDGPRQITARTCHLKKPLGGDRKTMRTSVRRPVSFLSFQELVPHTHTKCFVAERPYCVRVSSDLH